VLTYLIIWTGIHRTAIFGLVALGLWVASYVYYLKNDIRNYFKVRSAHRWGVDMAKKSVTAGRAGLR